MYRLTEGQKVQGKWDNCSPGIIDSVKADTNVALERSLVE